MYKYLENNICKFTPLFKIDFSKKTNILSLSLFKMKTLYKKFHFYLNGLKYLSKKIKKKNLNFEIRLFIDNSIYKDKKIMEILKKLDNINLILYHCPSFIKGEYHRGTFGTVIRFFPMFNFKNNDSDIVIVIDTDDIYINYLDKLLNSYKFLKKNKYLNDLSLFYIGSIAKKINNIDNNIIPYIQAGVLLNKYKMDKTIIEKYLYDTLEKKTIDNKKFKNNKIVLSKTVDNYIYYTFDEIFLNNNLIKYIIKNKKKICFINEYSIIYNIYYIYHEWTYDIEPKIYEYFFKYIFKYDKNFKYINLTKSRKYLDDILYNALSSKQKLTEPKLQLCKRIYKFYTKVIKTKHAHFFNKDFLKYLLSSKNKGIIFKKEMNFINFKNIKNIKIYEKKINIK